MNIWDQLDRMLPEPAKPPRIEPGWVAFKSAGEIVGTLSKSRPTVETYLQNSASRLFKPDPVIGFVEKVNTLDEAEVDVGIGARVIVRVPTSCLVPHAPPIESFFHIKSVAPRVDELFERGHPLWLVTGERVTFIGLHDDNRFGVLYGTSGNYYSLGYRAALYDCDQLYLFEEDYLASLMPSKRIK